MSIDHAMLGELMGGLMCQIKGLIRNGEIEEALTLCDRMEAACSAFVGQHDALLQLDTHEATPCPRWGNLHTDN